MTMLKTTSVNRNENYGGSFKFELWSHCVDMGYGNC